MRPRATIARCTGSGKVAARSGKDEGSAHFMTQLPLMLGSYLCVSHYNSELLGHHLLFLICHSLLGVVIHLQFCKLKKVPFTRELKTM